MHKQKYSKGCATKVFHSYHIFILENENIRRIQPHLVSNTTSFGMNVFNFDGKNIKKVVARERLTMLL